MDTHRLFDKMPLKPKWLSNSVVAVYAIVGKYKYNFQLFDNMSDWNAMT